MDIRQVDIRQIVVYHRRKGGPYRKEYGPREDSPLFGVVEGHKSRHTAELAVLYHVNAALADVVVQWFTKGEKAGKRALDGALIIEKGDVKRKGQVYQVKSQSQAGVVYMVYHDGEAWRCECDDYRWGCEPGNAGAPALELEDGLQVLCKHIAACLMFEELGLDGRTGA